MDFDPVVLSLYRSLKRSIMATDANSKKTITVTNDETGDSFALSTLQGSIGPDVIDIRDLYAKSGMFTFDPGYGATGSCLSGLTYIDGDRGVLLHRGYAIEELAEKSDFLEVAYLLLEGELPDAQQKAEFSGSLRR